MPKHNTPKNNPLINSLTIECTPVNNTVDNPPIVDTTVINNPTGNNTVNNNPADNSPVKIITYNYHGMTIEIPKDKFKDVRQLTKEFINVLSTIKYSKLDKIYLQNYDGFNLDISYDSFEVVSDSIDKLLKELDVLKGKITYINTWELQQVIQNIDNQEPSHIHQSKYDE